MSILFKTSSRPLVQTIINQNAVVRASACGLFGKGKNIRFPKDFDHYTGEERLVNVAKANNIPDPFDMGEQARGPATKDNPCIIHTFEDKRLVACKCEEDSSCFRYMWIELGELKRCECGFYFKAVPARKFWEEFAGK